MGKKLSYFFLLSAVSTTIFSGPIPIKLDAAKGNTGNLEFALQLPNNDTVQIDLSFQLLTISKNLDNSLTAGNNQLNNETTTTTTTATTTTVEDVTTTTTIKPEPKYVTVEEAIESFRQELIKKEKDIAGIIESDHPFYRHFKLEFEDNMMVTISCTYNANYRRHTLNISCYEYREYETERILSNGEVEMIRMQDMEFKTDVEYIDARNVKQVYTMDIL